MPTAIAESDDTQLELFSNVSIIYLVLFSILYCHDLPIPTNDIPEGAGESALIFGKGRQTYMHVC